MSQEQEQSQEEKSATVLKEVYASEEQQNAVSNTQSDSGDAAEQVKGSDADADQQNGSDDLPDADARAEQIKGSDADQDK